MPFDTAPAAGPVPSLSELMEDKTAIENLKKEVAELIKVIKSGTVNLEAASVIIDCAEAIAKTYMFQLREEPPSDDLPSEEELNALNNLIDVAREEIETRNETR